MSFKFTIKQQRFIDLYEGNATQAALKAGYSKKTAPFIGAENLKKPKILNAILKREKKRKKSNIMSREERQEFWSKMTNEAEKDSDKLKASELLGRSEADFTDKTQVEGSLTIEIVNYGAKDKNTT